jgi:DNA-binding MarR family transcriptional regulator
MRSKDPLKLENQLCFPLYAASRELIKRHRPYLDALGLTYTQYIAMLVIWEERKISVKKLGERLFLDSGTLTPVLKSLEAKRLVTRKRSDADERILMVQLSEKGSSLRERALNIPEHIQSSIPLDRDEIKDLLHLTNKLISRETEPEPETKENEKNLEVINLDLRGCKFYFEVHERIAKAFNFSERYERNWDAFRQLIYGEKNPLLVRILGLRGLPESWKRDMDKMLDILDEKKQNFPGSFDYQLID